MFKSTQEVVFLVKWYNDKSLTLGLEAWLKPKQQIWLPRVRPRSFQFSPVQPSSFQFILVHPSSSQFIPVQPSSAQFIPIHSPVHSSSAQPVQPRSVWLSPVHFISSQPVQPSRFIPVHSSSIPVHSSSFQFIPVHSSSAQFSPVHSSSFQFSPILFWWCQRVAIQTLDH